MRSPKNLKEVQQLLGRLTALSRFVPQLAKWIKPMTQMLRKTTKFNWNEACEDIFNELREFLSSLTIIQKPRQDHPIIVYLAVSEEAVNAALVQALSRALHADKTRYQMIEKVALALVLTARWMRPYFQNHAIMVKTNYHLYIILSKPDLAG